MEDWVDIEEFENKYKVSINGEIRSENYLNTGKPKILKPKVNKQGILEITLNKNDKHHYKTVARLVYESFMKVKLGRNDVLIYKDGDKTNCALSNLELITRGKKQEMTFESGKRQKDRTGREYLLKYEFYDQIATIKQLAKEHNISSEVIQRRLRDQRWNIYEAVEIPKQVYNKGVEKNGRTEF